MTCKQLLKKYIPESLLRCMLDVLAPIYVLYYRSKNLGKGTIVEKTVHVLGWKSVRIGDNTSIGEGTCINVNNRTAPGCKVKIGNDCFIGRRNFFTNGHSIIISDYFMSAPNCSFVGQGHLYGNPFVPYISTGTTNEDRIFIGTNCWFGVGVTVVGHVHIGHGSVIGAGTLVTKDIPPFSLVVGSPGRIIKRYDTRDSRWRPVGEYTKEMESLLPDEVSYLALLRQNTPSVNMAFAAAGKSMGDLP